MDEVKTITATEASRSFSELLHRVCYGGESFIIKKGNRMMAQISPVVSDAQKIVSPNNTALPVFDINEPAPEGVTPEEAEYYKTVIEQMRQSMLESQ